MHLDSSEDSAEGSDYSFDSDSDSDDFYNGYCEKPKKIACNFVSLPKLRNEYNAEMEMSKKNLLFIYAGEEEDIAFMETLLRDGVSVDCVGQDGWTALMKACLNGKPNVVTFLLANGSNPNFEAGSFTPLMACCTFSSATEETKCACLQFLLRSSPDVNAQDKHKTTALMHAASSGYLSLVNRLLYARGINVHVRDLDGWNALFHGVSNGRIGVVKRLIDRGLDYKSYDVFGKTPLMLAQERGYKHVYQLLLNYEDVEVIVDESKHKTDGYLNCLSELPNEDGEGGFTFDTHELLSLYGLNKVDNIPFADFLNMREKGLYEAGMKIGIHRRFVLKNVIHKYHLSPWKKSSIVAITRGVPLGLEEVICILGSITKHLTIIKASLRYVKTRVDAREEVTNVNFQKDTILSLISCYLSNKLVHERLCVILDQKKHVKTIEIEDLIVRSPQKGSKMKTAFKFGLVILGATSASYLILRFGFKKELSLGDNYTLKSMRWF